MSFLPLGVRLGGGPNRPPRPPGRPPAGWDRSARPPQAPRAPLETEGLGKAMNSAELRHYTHANTRARTQLRCGLGVPPPSCTPSDSRASETVLPLMGEACVIRLTNKACHDQTEKPTKTVCRKSNPSVSGLALRSIPKLASSSPDGGGGGGGGGTQREQNKPLPCKWCNSIHLRVAPREPGSLAALQLPPRPAPPRAPRAPRPRPWWPPRPCLRSAARPGSPTLEEPLLLRLLEPGRPAGAASVACKAASPFPPSPFLQAPSPLSQPPPDVPRTNRCSPVVLWAQLYPELQS